MTSEPKVTVMRDQQIYRQGQLPILGVYAEFMLGDRGPFIVQIPKSDNWDRELQQRITDEVNRVRSIAP